MIVARLTWPPAAPGQPAPASPRATYIFTYDAVGLAAPNTATVSAIDDQGRDITGTVFPAGQTATVIGTMITMPLLTALPANTTVYVRVLIDDPPQEPEDELVLAVGA